VQEAWQEALDSELSTVVSQHPADALLQLQLASAKLGKLLSAVCFDQAAAFAAAPELEAAASEPWSCTASAVQDALTSCALPCFRLAPQPCVAVRQGAFPIETGPVLFVAKQFDLAALCKNLLSPLMVPAAPLHAVLARSRATHPAALWWNAPGRSVTLKGQTPASNARVAPQDLLQRYLLAPPPPTNALLGLRGPAPSAAPPPAVLPPL
jgi:hypothetical protein